MFRLALDVAAATSTVPVSGCEMLTRDWIEDKHGTFQSPDPVFAPVLDRDVAASEVNEAGFAGMENAAVCEDVPDIFVAQVALSESTTSMLGDACDPVLTHPTPPSRCPNPPSGPLSFFRVAWPESAKRCTYIMCGATSVSRPVSSLLRIVA